MADGPLALRPREWDHIVGRYDQASLRGHVTAKRSDQMEAVMVLARAVTDPAGRASPIFIPPALAQAICDTLSRDKPLEHAMRVAEESRRGKR